MTNSLRVVEKVGTIYATRHSHFILFPFPPVPFKKLKALHCVSAACTRARRVSKQQKEKEEKSFDGTSRGVVPGGKLLDGMSGVVHAAMNGKEREREFNPTVIIPALFSLLES